MRISRPLWRGRRALLVVDHPSVLTELNKRTRNIRTMCFSLSVVRAYVYRLIVNFYLRSPATFTRWGSPSKGAPARKILAVKSVRRISKINKPVVASIAIPVVYFVLRPRSGCERPRKMVRVVTKPVHHYPNIPSFPAVPGATPIASGPNSRRYQPMKSPCGRIIAQSCPQIRNIRPLRHIGFQLESSS